jgi:transitional endoplasmic reticulum ATPase
VCCSGASATGDASSAEERVVNALLTEMDGIGESKNVFVIGATNKPVEELDPAITRPGRLDQLVYVGLPTYEARLAILQATLENTPKDKDLDDSLVSARFVARFAVVVNVMVDKLKFE